VEGNAATPDNVPGAGSAPVESAGVAISQSPENSEWDRLTYKGVTVDFEQNGNTASVFDITSGNKRSGEATEALGLLKKKFGNVVTDSVVEDSSEAIAFWQSMLNKGIASKAKRTDGVELSPAKTAPGPASLGSADLQANGVKAGDTDKFQELKNSAYKVASGIFGKDIYAPQVQTDWQNLLDAMDAKDGGKLSRLAEKYRKDAELDGMGAGTSGAGPGKVRQARRGAAQLGIFADQARRILNTVTQDASAANRAKLKAKNTPNSQDSQDSQDSLDNTKVSQPPKETNGVGGFDAKAWNKAREDRIKASKKSGSIHLDDVTPSVEAMRGKVIHSAHDPKEQGVVRTVDNNGNVYVQWSDEYSGGKNSASETDEPNKNWIKTSKSMPIWKKKNGERTLVLQTSLGPSDLKDYVFTNSVPQTAQSGAPQDASAANRAKLKAKVKQVPKDRNEADAAIQDGNATRELVAFLKSEKDAVSHAEAVSKWRTQYFGNHAETIASGDISRSDYEKLSDLVARGSVSAQRATEMIDSAADAGVIDKRVAENIKNKIKPVTAATTNRRNSARRTSATTSRSRSKVQEAIAQAAHGGRAQSPRRLLHAWKHRSELRRY
jgi:hypothetical protein